LCIAVGINGLNILLDGILIFGAGPIPPLGVAGAAWASSATQWLGALWLLRVIHLRFGLSLNLHWNIVRRMLKVGRDMVVRTASLSVFLLLCARAATRIDSDAGAAHQVVRQVWIFTALFLDAYAAAAQSLIGYFFGAGRLALARRVAAVSTLWCVGTGCALALAMILGESLVARLLVPMDARDLFAGAWLMSALFQPINGLSFITDGIHWGTGDFAYLRDAMLVVTVIALGSLFWMETTSGASLTGIWMLTGVWISLRALAGALRVWPGIGRAPLTHSDRA
jgi:MATE family multidrug resistance protein